MLFSQPPKYPHPGVPLVSEQPPQPFHATCREAHWHTWLRDFDALYLIMNYASAAVTLRNAITSAIRQMGRFCLAYAAHLLSPAWGEEHLVPHTGRACGNSPVSTVSQRKSLQAINRSCQNGLTWRRAEGTKEIDVNRSKSAATAATDQVGKSYKRGGKVRRENAEERYSISESLKDEMSQLTAWCVIKVIPSPDHAGMLFAPLTLLHYPHCQFLWISHFGVSLWTSLFSTRLYGLIHSFNLLLLLSPLLNLASGWSLIQEYFTVQWS